GGGDRASPRDGAGGGAGPDRAPARVALGPPDPHPLAGRMGLGRSGSRAPEELRDRPARGRGGRASRRPAAGGSRGARPPSPPHRARGGSPARSTPAAGAPRRPPPGRAA